VLIVHTPNIFEYLLNVSIAQGTWNVAHPKLAEYQPAETLNLKTNITADR
jgi:hypothetical protein